MTDAAPAAEPAAHQPASLRLVLPLLGICMFSAFFNNFIIAPLLADIANDLDVAVSTAGFLITVYALSAGVFALVLAPWLDRVARRPVIAACLAGLAAAMLASALVPSFLLLLLCRTVAGLAVAGLQPSIFAAVGDYVPYEQRGRAMGWLTTANLTAGILGVPAGALLADLTSWRATFVVSGMLTASTIPVFIAYFPRVRVGMPSSTVGYRADYIEVFRNRFANVMLASNTLLALGAFAWVTFMGAFFINRFGLSTGQVGLIIGVGSAGVMVGSNVGGRLADLSGKKQVLLVGGLTAPFFLFLETNLLVNVWFAALMHFPYAMLLGARMSAAMALMTAIIPEKRGTLMAINSSGTQFGVMSGSALGGLAISLGGYSALGVAACAVLIVSALLLYPVDERAAIAPQTRPVGI